MKAIDVARRIACRASREFLRTGPGRARSPSHFVSSYIRGIHVVGEAPSLLNSRVCCCEVSSQSFLTYEFLTKYAVEG